MSQNQLLRAASRLGVQVYLDFVDFVRLRSQIFVLFRPFSGDGEEERWKGMLCVRLANNPTDMKWIGSVKPKVSSASLGPSKIGGQMNTI